MLKHILIRLCVLFIVPIVVSSIMGSPSGNSDAMGNAMAKGYTILATIFISWILLVIGFLIDTIIFYRKKQQSKVNFNIILFLTILIFGVFFFVRLLLME